MLFTDVSESVLVTEWGDPHPVGRVDFSIGQSVPLLHNCSKGHFSEQGGFLGDLVVATVEGDRVSLRSKGHPATTQQMSEGNTLTACLFRGDTV